MSIRLDIPYGDTTMPAELPDRTFMIPYGGGKKLAAIDDLVAAVAQALAQTLGSKPIAEIARPASRVVIAFDDPTVPSYGPIRRIAIQQVMAQLEAAGVAPDAIQFICANSLHRKFRREELAVILGDDLVAQMGERLRCHDAEDPDGMVYLGQTPKGRAVEISRAVMESDLAIYVNSAHYRGFAGGWKSICVGLSSFRSIRCHHTPDGMSMSVENNPMHAMLDEMGVLFESKYKGTVFKIDAIEANPFQTAAVFAGSPWETRKAALELLKAAYPPRRDLSDERYDVILYGIPNWSPYAIFAKVNPMLTLISSGLGYLGGTIQALGKPGGTVIMATPCPLEWDEVHHPSYPDVWDNVLTQTRDPYEIEHRYTDHYATDAGYIEKYRHEYAFHPVHAIFATQPLRRLKHCGRVIVAGIQDPAVAHRLGFEAAESVDAALEMAAATHGPDFSIAYAQHPAAPTKVTM